MPAQTSADDSHEAIVEVWRAESARLVGALTRMTRNLQLAEDLAQDALVAALEQWPTAGVPQNPIAWLMTIAKRRGIDHFRRADTLRRKTAEVEQAHGGQEVTMPDLDGQVDDIEDDVLRLIFLSCHPALTAESRAALTLRLVGGLTTAEIARGFLTTESTIGQRISRAKKTLSAAHAEFELPTGPERTRRIDDVMAVIYLIFNEGYTATAGADWMRPDLANEATRLARMLVALSLRVQTPGIQGGTNFEPPRPWWLKLDARGEAIEAAGPLDIDGMTLDTELKVRFPRPIRMKGGGLRLAMLARPGGGPEWALRIWELAQDADGTPRLVPGSDITTAEHCAHAPLAASPDGDWVYYVPLDAPTGWVLRAPTVRREGRSAVASAE